MDARPSRSPVPTRPDDTEPRPSFLEELAKRIALAPDSGAEPHLADLAVPLETLLLSLPIGFALLDADAQFCVVSEIFAAMSGLAAAEYPGRQAADLFDPGVWVHAEPLYRRSLLGETILDQEIHASSSSLLREERHRLASFYPVRHADGRTVGVGIVLLDITDRKQAELAHTGGVARYRSLISATTQVIWVTDENGRLEDWHDWHMYTGQPVAEIADSDPTVWLLGAVHPDERTMVAQRCAHAISAGKACEIECRLRRFDREYLYFSLRTVPVRDEATGRITEWVGAGTNITPRKEAEAARDAALARETRIARTLQRALLAKPPGDAFAGLEFETLYQPAYDEMLVGGDFYDAFSLEGGRVALVVGDVSGKGLEAAAHTAELKFTLRALLRDVDDPGQAVARLNTYLRTTEQRYEGPSLPGHLVALTVAIVAPVEEEALIIVAGMEPPLILRRDTPAEALSELRAETIAASGLPLGVLAEWEEEHTAARVAFHAGDLLLLSTDGLTEARRPNTEAEFFGLDGVIASALTAIRYRSVTGSLEEIGTEIIGAAQSFAGGRLHDDVCLLLAQPRA